LWAAILLIGRPFRVSRGRSRAEGGKKFELMRSRSNALPSTTRKMARTLVGLVFASGLVALAVVSGACSSTPERTPFVDEPTPVPTAPPTSTPPKPTPQPTPGETENDGGAEADAPDTCKRTAPSNKCGLVPQCGCATGETCDVDDGAGNVSCVTAGKAAMGTPCTTTAGCAAGLTCVFGTCHAYCDKPGAACTQPKTGACLQVKGQGGTAIPNYAVCLVACDLRDAASCGGTTAAGTGICMLDGQGGTDCANVAGTPKALNQACAPEDDCAGGLVCVVTGSATTGSCKKWCRVGTNDCGGTTTCNSFQTKVMVGTTEYAACP